MRDHERATPSRTADERDSLTGFLQYQRETLTMKCAGLTADQLRKKAVPSSGLSLLGLVRHAAEIERSWFQVVWNTEDVPAYWPRKPDGTFADFDVDTADPDEAFMFWRTACARSRAIAESVNSLDTSVRWRDEVFSLRYVLTHMIEEYARHNGHADLLREAIDGVTGE
ncbi:DinB family protein [Streptomyces sp. NBC_01433]|uniref:DinB family protein n=1 Tax=Streptomyces sp. NBC_01433 TaxID=2903864 RepID=UPI00224DDA9D|nr:DinB family protein [Streptomyces sp. NBC_01433]MCX4680966.1 DinB family protein [Streptomyces sp. NBC_01433]